MPAIYCYATSQHVAPLASTAGVRLAERMPPEQGFARTFVTRFVVAMLILPAAALDSGHFLLVGTLFDSFLLVGALFDSFLLARVFSGYRFPVEAPVNYGYSCRPTYTATIRHGTSVTRPTPIVTPTKTTCAPPWK